MLKYCAAKIDMMPVVIRKGPRHESGKLVRVMGEKRAAGGRDMIA